MTTPGCNCGAIYECLLGKCVQIVVTGIYSGIADGDCNCCEDFNTTYKLTTFGTLPPPVGCSECHDQYESLIATACGCFGSSNQGMVLWGFDKSCDTYGMSMSGTIMLHDFEPGFHPGFVTFEFGGDDSETAMLKFAQLCAGASIELPLTYQHADAVPPSLAPPCYANVDDAKMTITLIDDSECTPVVETYDCVSDVCSPVFDDTGAYATLPLCVASGCEPPPETYRCINGLCTDPQDGTGAYSTIDDCVASGCGAPDCFTFNDCDSNTLVAEIASLNDCNDGTYDWLLSNLNGVYFLPFSSPGLYHIDLGTEGDYGDPGVLFRRLIVVAGVHEEVYCRAIDLLVTCVDGRTTITEVDFYLHSFAWTDPAAPVYVPFSTVAYNPTSTLSGTAVDCTASFMLSVFTFTDCLSASVTFSISGTIS